MTPGDAELVARVLTHDDRRAFALLVERHAPALRRLLTRLARGDTALADDLAQETFLRAYRRLATFSGARLGAWLAGIGLRLFLDHLRRPRLEPLGDDVEDAGEPVAPPPHVLRVDLDGAMATLRDEERAALALVFGDDLTHDEAAAILGWPVGTLKSHVARARAKLARRLASYKETP